MRVAIFVGVLLMTTGLAWGDGPGLAGQWVTTVNGQQVPMTLNPDGSALFLGSSGAWQVQGQTLVLANEKGQIQGSVQGAQLVFTMNGQPFVFTRLGGGGGAEVSPPRTPGPPFKPSKTLPGRELTPDGTQMKITVPEGWTGQWTQVGGMPVYAFSVPGILERATIGATARVLGEERHRPMATLLQQGAAVLWGTAAAASQPVVNESFTVGGHPAGRVIYRATVPHQRTGQMVKLEGYLGLVLIDDWAFGFAGLYEEADSDKLRAGMDTLLASLRGTPPARNAAAEAQIVGCWESGTGTAPSTSTKGSAFTSAYLRIAPGGRYSRRGGVSVSTASGAEYGGAVSSAHGEVGRFTIHGATITWLPAGGGSYSNTVGAKPGGLYLDGKLWIKCT